MRVLQLLTVSVLALWSLCPAAQTVAPAAAPANPAAAARTEYKIGFVHGERILRESPAAVKIAAKLDKEFEKRRADLKVSADRIAELQRQLERNSVTMPEAERRVKERDLASFSRDYQRTQRELQEDIDLRTNEELRELTRRANKIIKDIGDAEGFDIVVQHETTVYVSPRIDLTDRVIKALGN
jgi:outer membrane protein